MATLAALHWREASGRGQMIDVSGAEALMRYLEYTLLLYHGSREVRERLGGMDIAVSVYTFIPVKDGWAFIAGYTDPNFGAICRIMGRPELAQDPRFRTTLDRTQPDKRARFETRSPGGRSTTRPARSWRRCWRIPGRAPSSSAR